MLSTSSARGSAATPLTDQTIGAYLHTVVHQHRNRDALVACHQNFHATYDHLWDLSGRVACSLLARGVRRGDRVALWSASRYEWIAVQYATARIGAILVCVNPMYEAAELRHVLSHSGASLLLMAQQFRTNDCTRILAAVRPHCATLRDVVVFEADWQHFLHDGESVPVSTLDQAEQLSRASDPINIQYTSGTTGRPKGAVLTHNNILNNARFVCQAIGFTEHDRVCVPVPLFHCFGMVLGSLGTHSHGATLVLPAESFDATATLAAVEEHRCTALYGVPTMFITALERQRTHRYDLSTLRTGLIGGAPCPPDLRDKIRTHLHIPDLSIVCGMTETSPISTQVLPSDPPGPRAHSVGRPTPHVEVKIVEPGTDEAVPVGAVGEQCTRGYSVMARYWDDPAATQAAIDGAGWMHTGDLATMDQDGFVTLVGRMKEMIIRGGENIYPREIEELLRTHPDITDAYIIGVPDDRLGEQVMAWVQLRDNAPSTTGEELAAFCAGKITRSKIPSLWRFTSVFPTTATGKIQKFRMREIAIEEQRQLARPPVSNTALAT